MSVPGDDRLVGAVKPPAGDGEPMRCVLDTNIVLDLWLFGDPCTARVEAAIAARRLSWLVTERMQDEWACVLAYPHLQRRLPAGVAAGDWLAGVTRHATRVPPAPAAALRCQDRDDQVFIDLALAHGAWLVSKDKAVLKLRRRLGKQGVRVGCSLAELPALA